MTRQVLWLCLILMLAGCGSTGGKDVVIGPTGTGNLSKETAALFDWFDGLGLMDAGGKAFVKVATGEWSKSGNDPATNRYVYGFLNREEGGFFEIQTLDLLVRPFEQTPEGTEVHEAVGLELADLQAVAQKRLDGLRARANGEEVPDGWHRFGERIGERAEVVVLARACAAHGLDVLAEALVEQATALPHRRTKEPPPGLRAAVSEELADAMMWRAVLAFGDTKAHDRPALKAQLRSIAETFPSSEHAERAADMAGLLDQMIKEDIAHEAKPPATDKTEEIARLIHALRDQNGHQWSQPGACDIFADERGEQSPASKLVAMGFDAVPQLIEVVDDRRLTRSVGFHRDFYFSHHVLRVGDAARAIIERIAGRRFYTRTYTNAAMVKDGQASEIKQAIEAWWAERSVKGEEQMLIEAVERGDHNSHAQSRILMQKYPDKATEAIIKGMHTSKEIWPRFALLSELGSIPGARSRAVLLSEMNGQGPLKLRVVAARILHRRGEKGVVAWMIKTWETLPPIPSGNPDEPELGVNDLYLFLAGDGEVEGVEALGRDWLRHPTPRRLSIVQAMASTNVFPDVDKKPSGDSPHEVAIERFLVMALDDLEERVGMSGYWDGVSFADPRICDIAGHILQKRWPDRYAFSLGASLDAREKARFGLKNVWRARQGLGMLPVPTLPAVVPVDPKALAPHLRRYLGADTDEARQAAAAPIESWGLSALEGVLAEMASESDDEDRALLGLLAVRLSNTIRAVKFEGPSPDASLRTRANALRGKPLTEQAMLDLMLETMRKPAPGLKGLVLFAQRHDGGMGVTLTVTLLDKAEAKTGSQDGWRQKQRVASGARQLYGSSGFTSNEYGLQVESYKDFLQRAKQAIDAPLEAPFIIRLGLVRQD